MKNVMKRKVVIVPTSITLELYGFVKKLSEFDSFLPNSGTELMPNFDLVLNSDELISKP